MTLKFNNKFEIQPSNEGGGGGGGNAEYVYTEVTNNLASVTGTIAQSKYGKIGNFSSGNFAYLLQNFTSIGTKPWSFEFAFTTGADVTTNQEAISMSTKGCSFVYINNSRIQWFLSSDGSNWDIVNGGQYLTGLEPYTDYLIKITYTGTKYIISQFVNGSWVDKSTVTSSTPINQDENIFVGVNRRNNNNGYQPFLGSIDLTKCKLTIDGEVVWQGVTAV